MFLLHHVFLISQDWGEETEQAQKGVGVSDRAPAVRCGGWSAEESGWERLHSEVLFSGPPLGRNPSRRWSGHDRGRAWAERSCLVVTAGWGCATDLDHVL